MCGVDRARRRATVVTATPRTHVRSDGGDAEAIMRGFIEDGKVKLAWNLPRLLLPKNRVKLLLNIALDPS
jgi:hypothetical protein